MDTETRIELSLTERRAILLNVLHDKVVSIKFKKVDGTERVMQCTLKQELLPPPQPEVPGEIKKSRLVNEDVINVWDLESNGWRSFKISNLISADIVF